MADCGGCHTCVLRSRDCIGDLLRYREGAKEMSIMDGINFCVGCAIANIGAFISICVGILIALFFVYLIDAIRRKKK